MHHARNTVAVLIVTALTAVAVYAGVEVVAGAAAVGTPGSPDPTDTVAMAGQRYLCPRTGCTATTCHGATDPVSVQGGAAAGASGAAPGSATQTCPRTGCTAATCHGATGSAPPTSGGMGRMRGSGRSYRGRGTSHSYQSQGDLTFQ
jgi:hypothetical protein